MDEAIEGQIADAAKMVLGAGDGFSAVLLPGVLRNGNCREGVNMADVICKCPACCGTYEFYRHPGVTAKERYTAVCYVCGHIFYAMASGESRNLTAREKSVLKNHPLAEAIRELQNRVTKWMIG